MVWPGWSICQRGAPAYGKRPHAFASRAAFKLPLTACLCTRRSSSDMDWVWNKIPMAKSARARARSSLLGPRETMAHDPARHDAYHSQATVARPLMPVHTWFLKNLGSICIHTRPSSDQCYRAASSPSAIVHTTGAHPLARRVFERFRLLDAVSVGFVALVVRGVVLGLGHLDSVIVKGPAPGP
jgi:hypothetical protein